VYPDIFQIAAGNTAVTALLGTTPATRFWPFGNAPQDETRPYAVHQLVYGSPVNTLGCVPGADNFGVQVDVYAKTVSAARSVTEALRDAFELHGHIVAWNGEFWEPATGLFRISFTVEFWTDRN
jgi:hypothetical protein